MTNDQIPNLADTADMVMRSNVKQGWAAQYPKATHLDIKAACDEAAKMDDVWSKEAQVKWGQAVAETETDEKSFINTYRLRNCIATAKAILIGRLANNP